ncbi:GTP cyclohydrolase [Sphingopyxis sp. H038]|uniref:GTP cyclohydrolase II n=1 Tax=unclassified Sphingopyxis TaxID=2614943 RepID=UPI000731B638|nr:MULTISPECIES: GTP cyclohydrolase II [unclassified Sphingopyxis]KTE03924.1 GTP cyclohydrolase [Sphingopyxis sp. H012]KTE08077.1 GTP cyclohydrolase [Sphingopyxis sp. H053]KTE13965.1 GTP cyclohydrolase [Sphingopyxis sp. H093]KTE29486.1 GTP cyclohydrolase [Sphingopyxis sp. H080]KTE34282.1 GTP cyclohydrolase [Sphingopyxis sp. H038]
MGARRAARAIDALRRGWPFRVQGTDGALDLLAVESARDDALAEFGSHDVLLSGERAVTLKLTNQRVAATPGPVRLANAADTVTAALAIADPALDLANPLKGPFRTIPTSGEAAATAAMTMARHAGLLPAFFVREATGEAETMCSVDDVAALLDPTRLQVAARARLPVEASESAEIVAFRSPEEASDHVALVIGKRDGNPPVVRLHSECLTGDVLGSLKCDCGPQLHAALHAMADAPWGVLLYLRQEGRGIGLVNKLRAYALQDQGYDTVDANLRLGFPVEARDFAIAGRMLKLLNIPRIRLMTNNPEKVARLDKEGVEVVERLPLALPTNKYNEQYLATKRDRTGHQL